MFRNSESHFANVPNIDIQRMKMRIPNEHKTSFNVGQVIPIFIDQDILPGDTVKMKHSAVVRLQTMLTPIMDNLVLDFYWFFVPYRLVWDHWREFMQENTTGPWVQTTQYAIPSISAPVSTGFATGTLADYMGLPVGVTWNNTDKYAPSALPFRGYAAICTEFFRDENLTYPLNIPKNDSNQTGTNGSSYINDVANGGMPFIAAKTHDYFTSALPSAQKAAAPVTLPLINGSDAPVIASNKSHTNTYNMIFKVKDGNDTYYNSLRDIGTDVPPGDLRPFGFSKSEKSTGINSQVHSYNTDPNGGNYLYPVNLWADLSTSVGAVTVNELRLAFQLQKWYERAAMGSRYTELIRNMFSVVSPDARLQRPEYLGGNRVPIQINEVTNTSSDSGTDSVPLGHLGAKSNTADVNIDFEHSFTEHGMLFGLAVARIANHTYGQGITKPWLRKTWTDFYWPVFAHLGEMPIPEVSIYADGYTNSDSVFGYQEAWAEYRYHPSRVSGEMRPGISNSLASWHLADYYTSAPTLSDDWIREDKTNVDRVLAVTSSVSNQLFGDFYFEAEYTRPMPVYSVPGLIDHF